MSTINGHKLEPREAVVYGRAADKSRASYMRKHGGPAVDVSEYRSGTVSVVVGSDGKAGRNIRSDRDWTDDTAREAAAELVHRAAAEWRAQHLEKREAAAARAGETAVRKRLRELAEVFGDSEAAARLEVLAPAKPARRAAAKPAARKTAKPAAVPVDVPAAPVESAPVCRSIAPCGKCEGCRAIAAMPPWTPDRDPAAVLEGEAPAAELAPVTPIRPDVVPVPEFPSAGELVGAVAPETVPAPMPRQTWQARKASRRELAAEMRAAGLVPSGAAWELAKAGVPLERIAGELARLEGSAAGV